jgi:hypothetical protein
MVELVDVRRLDVLAAVTLKCGETVANAETQMRMSK